MHGFNELKSINEKAAALALKKPLKPSAELKKFLQPFFPSIRPQKDLTKADLTEFKCFIASRPDNANKRRIRREIKKWFGKSVAELTLAEWQDYQKPNFHAPKYLKELWPQLTAAEQDLVKQGNEWAFTFPSSFETDEQFLRACARRLKQFFGRKFHVTRTGAIKKNK